MVKDLEIHENIRAARLAACHKWPYLSTGLWAMNIIPSTKCESGGHPTMGVDKYWRLYYHPDIIEQWDIPTIQGVLYHEVMHLLRRHHLRCENMQADPSLANVAMDAEINDDCIEDCLSNAQNKPQAKLPEGAITPQSLGLEPNLLWETYYAELLKNAEEVSPANYGGSSADGKQREWEDGSPEEEGNPSGVTLGRSKMIDRKIAEDVKQEASKGRGDIPKHMEVWANHILEPIIPWQKELRAAVKSAYAHAAGQTDYTYRRPARKQAAFGDIIAPSMYSPIPRVAVVVDTSGSMLGGELEMAMSEVKGICKACGSQSSDLYVIACDSEPTKAQKVFRTNDINLSGGGGTDMGVGIKSAGGIRPRIDICIVLTDGICPWGEWHPPFKVIGGIVGDNNTDSWPIPKWVKPIRISNE